MQTNRTHDWYGEGRKKAQRAKRFVYRASVQHRGQVLSESTEGIIYARDEISALVKLAKFPPKRLSRAFVSDIKIFNQENRNPCAHA